ncbi:right-handed parallel beta-helix repeat-containing protein [Roseibacillus ishigakijimensis]|uniref:Right-handed parallel beta-helix repeat-containing protein n=1 Tax=Roseibacillus ishigakijimensis TaxID=454146 RepID=A0A934RTD3_9BACT|nr:right-handed parallel beta-helix repeat-containing protein [Roseibacillus ishigakijimensis]MBK1835093.1 right-handed parallel beta-helix repeat-containing protein [Roseibacillus ishigakijimensis]
MKSTILFFLLSPLTLVPLSAQFQVGSESYPTLAEVRDQVRALPKDEPVTITVAAGRYELTEPVRFTAADSGRPEAPITYRAEGEVVFDGSVPLSLQGWETVAGEEELARLSEAARGQVVKVAVREEQAHQLLRQASPSRTLVMQDAELLRLSRFPNVGFAHAKELLEADEGTRFQIKPVMGTWEEPKGPLFTLREEPAGTWQQWAREVESTRRVMASGYLSAQWYRSSQRLRSVDAETGAIRFVQQTRYGLEEMVHQFQSRQAFYHLLCEIDEPGEWYYDHESREFYFWPVAPVGEETRLSFSAGEGFLHLDGASHLRFEGFSARGFAQGEIVRISGGEDNEVRAGQFFQSTATALSVAGKNNRVRGCDVFDVTRFARLAGGVASSAEITPGGNVIANCHFYLDALAGASPSVGISGVGQIFRNNLIHNIPGQAVVFRGNDHLIERNEFFNIGFEEGDGATIYTGAEFWGYGVKLRHNFLHHIMSTDGLMTRSGIMLDDHHSGTEVLENIFYKTGHGSLAINGGTGLTVHGNIFLNGNHGVWVRIIGDVKGRIANLAKFETGELKRGDKHDYIWRTEQVVGENGWNKEPWTKYPTFAKVMNQPNERRFFPIEIDVRDTLGANMSEGLTYRHPQIPAEWLTFHGTREIDPQQVFQNPEALDFRYRAESAEGMPAIPFPEIGLVLDDSRRAMPEKAAYRQVVREHFRGRPSCDRRAKYDFDKVNETIYWNSGRVLQELPLSH